MFLLQRKKDYILHSYFHLQSLSSLLHLSKIETSLHERKWHHKKCVGLQKTLVKFLLFYLCLGNERQFFNGSAERGFGELHREKKNLFRCALH